MDEQYMNKWMLEKTRWTKHMNTLTNLHFNNNICTCVYVRSHFQLSNNFPPTCSTKKSSRTSVSLLLWLSLSHYVGLTAAGHEAVGASARCFVQKLANKEASAIFWWTNMANHQWLWLFLLNSHFFGFHHFKQVRGCFFLVAIIK